MGHSVPSTIILVVGYFALKSLGAKYLTKLLDGQIFASLHCFDMKIIHVQTIFLTLISEIEKKSWKFEICCVPS